MGLGVVFLDILQLKYTGFGTQKFQTTITDPGSPGNNRYNAQLYSTRVEAQINIDMPRKFPCKYLGLNYSSYEKNYTSTIM